MWTGGLGVSLLPGGRQDIEAVRPLGERLAAAGYRVLMHDRRNCGASDVVIAGEQSEQELQADDLYALLQHLGISQAWISGGSAGCRVSMLLAIRHPEVVQGMLLWWITGGQFAADGLANNYYMQFIEAARAGGMPAVCATPFFAERIAQNPANAARLLAMPVDAFIAQMQQWYDQLRSGADLPVLGATEAELRTITAPVCIIPGTDQTHPHAVGERLHRIITQSEFHPIYTDAEVAALPTPLDPAASLDRYRRIAEVFTPFLAAHAEAPATR